ncbi:MAG: cobalt-precorrin 5A hydrolase [Desulfobacterales bacterium]|nr:cobalt-precorrin 5A hydrolase [Desulfobacterales bacterium]
MDLESKFKIAVWAITQNGFKIAKKLTDNMSETYLISFNGLFETLSNCFNDYKGHIFIMSAGIVVRVIAPLIKHKTIDPAVVVVDEAGKFSISLLSGHIGGANELAKKVGNLIGAVPVITTATDINGVLAVDVLAREKNLFIENINAVKKVNMALLEHRTIYIHDPYNFISCVLPDFKISSDNNCDLFIDDLIKDMPAKTLILRPKSLVAGIGCNRNSSSYEIKDLIFKTFEKFCLSIKSLTAISTINLKADEDGLLSASKELKTTLLFFDNEALNKVKEIKNPSEMVEKHVGVKSVCEAAAICGSNMGQLIVPKQKNKNVTIAIARKMAKDFMK